MKFIKPIKEIAFNKEKGEFVFNPAEIDNTVTVYLHKQKQGFSMDIDADDIGKLEEILKRNKIDYTISAGNVLPF
jgi:hypothetical protein